MAWRDAVIAVLVLILAVTYFANWRDRENHKNDVIDMQLNYDRQIISLGEELAKKQFELKHATYFCIGLPSADPEYNGLPACYLGCMDYSMNGVNVRRAFVGSYNSTLNRLVEQSSKK